MSVIQTEISLEVPYFKRNQGFTLNRNRRVKQFNDSINEEKEFALSFNFWENDGLERL